MKLANSSHDLSGQCYIALEERYLAVGKGCFCYVVLFFFLGSFTFCLGNSHLSSAVFRLQNFVLSCHMLKTKSVNLIQILLMIKGLFIMT